MSRVQDMTEGKPSRQLLQFALPTFLGILFQQLYSVADSIIVGQLIGSNALAAIGSTSTLDWLLLGVAVNFTQGFAILISQSFGAHDLPAMRSRVVNAVFLSGGIGVALCVGCTLSVQQLLMLLDTPPDILDIACAYLSITFLCAPLIVFNNLASSILNALGNSRVPFLAMSAAVGVNIALDLLFIAGFGMGVEGASIATQLANVVAITIKLWALRAIPQLHLTRSDWRLHRHTCFSLVKAGAPLALQNVITASGGMVIQRAVNSFGTLFVAGYTAGRRVMGIMDAAGSALSYAIMIFAGQNYGARKPRRIRRGMRSCVALAILCAAITGAATYFLRAELVHLFLGNTQPEVVGYASAYLTALSLTCWMLYLLMIFRSAVQGIGMAWVLVVGGVLELAVRVAVVLFLPLTPTLVFYAESIAWALTGALMFAMYLWGSHRIPESAPADPHR